MFWVFVAAAADGRIGEKVIGCLRALQGAGMAHVARKLLLQVDAMREGSRRENPGSHQEQPAYFL